MVQKKSNWGFFWLELVLVCLGILMFDSSCIEQFTCNRERNECILQEKHLWESDFQEKERIKLSDILSVDLVHRYRHRVHHHGSYIPKIQIETKNKVIKVYDNTFNPFAGLSIVYDTKRLNTYLHSSEQYLTIQNHFLSVLVMALLCPMLALFFLYLYISSKKYQVNKNMTLKHPDKEKRGKWVLYTFWFVLALFLIGLINNLLVIFFIHKY